MSADNTIIVFSHLRRSVKEENEIGKSRFPSYTNVAPYRVYRVAHVQAWDNFEYYKEHAIYNLGYYLLEIFPSTSPEYESKESAMIAAVKLMNEVGYVEYGIQIVDTDYFLYDENSR